jgi:N utilization substance protein B
VPDRSTPAAGSRREAREAALLMIYEADVRAESPTDVLARVELESEPYTRLVVEGVAGRMDEIDAEIADRLVDWTLDRLPAMDRALLRMATFEVIGCPEVPTGAILNEAVELAGEYSTVDSGRFINGVLASLSRDTRS